MATSEVMGGDILKGYLCEAVQALEVFGKRNGALEPISWGDSHLRRISYTLE